MHPTGAGSSTRTVARRLATVFNGPIDMMQVETISALRRAAQLSIDHETPWELCMIAPFYGYPIWLNGERRVFPSVPAVGCFATGAGGSFTWIEPERQIAVVVRWIDPAHADAFFGQIFMTLERVQA